jgi:hypothetical protein
MYESDSQETHLQDLREQTEPWIPTDDDMKKFLDVSATAFADLDADLEDAFLAANIQTANSIEELKPFGDVVNTYPDQNEPVERYRKRVITKHKQITITGRPQELIEYTASLFDLDISQVSISNQTGNPRSEVEVPKEALDNIPLTASEVSSLLQDITAASYGADVLSRGTLEYISETEYQNTNYDPAKGYATLDQNGDITDGGTYRTAF